MPVAEEQRRAPRERRIRLFADARGKGAIAHERRLLAAARPALPVLNWVGQFAVPLRRLPVVGWVTSDPIVARAVLNDAQHFTLLGEGGVGHLWSQVLGDWVLDLFDGPGHRDLRTRSRELFTEANSAALVERAWGDRLVRERERFEAGGELDVAHLARVLVGRMVVELLGMPELDDAGCLEVFGIGEELAATALGSTNDTNLSEQQIARARELIQRLTGHLDEAYASASSETVIGRCRELGLGLQETKGLATLLMVAGTETAASSMARMPALLADSGELARLIAHPKHTDDAVREVLRVTSPAPLIGRSVSRDVEIAGRRLRAGDRIMLLIWTANNAAGHFRMERPYLPHNRQLWFGAGRHLCLGAPVARAELRAMLDLLIGDGREFEIVRREYGHRVLIPSYRSLVVRKR